MTIWIYILLIPAFLFPFCQLNSSQSSFSNYCYQVSHNATFSSSSIYLELFSEALSFVSSFPLIFDSSPSSRSASRSSSISMSMSSSSSSSLWRLVSLRLSYAPPIFFPDAYWVYYDYPYVEASAVIFPHNFNVLLCLSIASWLAYCSIYYLILSLYFCSYLIWS